MLHDCVDVVQPEFVRVSRSVMNQRSIHYSKLKCKGFKNTRFVHHPHPHGNLIDIVAEYVSNVETGQRTGSVKRMTAPRTRVTLSVFCFFPAPSALTRL